MSMQLENLEITARENLMISSFVLFFFNSLDFWRNKPFSDISLKIFLSICKLNKDCRFVVNGLLHLLAAKIVMRYLILSYRVICKFWVGMDEVTYLISFLMFQWPPVAVSYTSWLSKWVWWIVCTRPHSSNFWDCSTTPWRGESLI